MIPISIKVDSLTLELLDAYAISHGLNRSEVIRRAIYNMALNASLIAFISQEQRNKKNKLITFKIEEDVIREIDNIANNIAISRSKLIRAAIQQFCNTERNTEGAIKIKIEKGDPIW